MIRVSRYFVLQFGPVTATKRSMLHDICNGSLINRRPLVITGQRTHPIGTIYIYSCQISQNRCQQVLELVEFIAQDFLYNLRQFCRAPADLGDSKKIVDGIISYAADGMRNEFVFNIRSQKQLDMEMKKNMWNFQK